MPKKRFNISGPCIPDKHFMIPPQSRCMKVERLIENEEYFVLHAARQSGKTTFLLDLVNRLNKQGDCIALYFSLESVQNIDSPKEGIPTIISMLQEEFKAFIAFDEKFLQTFNTFLFNHQLKSLLNYVSMQLDKPLVLFFDETDCLANGTLISFLRQLRHGYVTRSLKPFVSSIGLVGMRNIRDYKCRIRDDKETLGSASPFNIVTEVFTLNDFTDFEVKDLLKQHTDQTGQAFSEEVIQLIYDVTQGQPWLVNALAKEIVENTSLHDSYKIIEKKHVNQAEQTIIDRRDAHIDSLLERLRENRVKKVVEPVITGDHSKFDPLDDDFQYVLDLGLLKIEKYRFLPANKIYEEVMIRTLAKMADHQIEEGVHLKKYFDHQFIRMKQLLSDFQQFWRENSKIWIERYQYKEAAPHLILMAFLHRVLNHGGSISRELATGRGRLDLCIHYKDQRYPIEIKIRRNTKTINEGKEQLWAYMDTLECDKGWLIVFDQRKSISWTKKIFWKDTRVKKKTIHIVGC